MAEGGAKLRPAGGVAHRDSAQHQVAAGPAHAILLRLPLPHFFWRCKQTCGPPGVSTGALETHQDAVRVCRKRKQIN